MNNNNRQRLLQQRADEQRIEVTRWARQYRQQYPEITWGEAIRLAEKHIREKGES